VDYILCLVVETYAFAVVGAGAGLDQDLVQLIAAVEGYILGWFDGCHLV
jgi:hypothetical protein